MTLESKCVWSCGWFCLHDGLLCVCVCACRWVRFGKYDLVFPAMIRFICCAPCHNMVVFIAHPKQETKESGFWVTCENQMLKVISPFTHPHDVLSSEDHKSRYFEEYYNCFCLYNESQYTPKNRGSLFTSMVPWRTFNIHRTVPLNKRVFIVEKGSLDFLNVLHTKKQWFFGNFSLKSFLENLLEPSFPFGAKQYWTPLTFIVRTKKPFSKMSFFKISSFVFHRR